MLQIMNFKRYLCTGLISCMMLVSSSFDIQAKSTSTLHIELTGGLGTAEIMTDEEITYPVDGGDDSFTFDKGTQLKITIHSKYYTQCSKNGVTTLLIFYFFLKFYIM